MATTIIKPVYAASAALTWTSAGTLANGSAAGCLAVDNTTNLYDDAFVYIAVGLGTIATPKYINIWASGSEDGTNYLGNSATTDAYSGTDAAVTLGAPTVFAGPYFQATMQASVTSKVLIPSVAKLLGCLALPRKWGLIIENQSGAAFGSLSASYTGFQLQNV